MAELLPILVRAENRLNESLAEYEMEISPLGLEFREIKLQLSIFQYEICAEMFGINSMNPAGFARQVALKGLIHRVYEFDILLNGSLIKRIQELATSRGLTIQQGAIKQEKIKWAKEFHRLRSWTELRNLATGHYDKDTNKQVQVVKSICEEEVFSVIQAFLCFNMSILNIVRNVGLGNDA